MSSFGGGISSFIRNQIAALDSEKMTFDIATFNDYTDEFAAEVAEKGGSIYSLPNPKKEGIRNYVKRYEEILHNYGPYDIVHCHVAGHRAFTFYLLSKRAGVERFIVHAHRSQTYYENGVPGKVKVLTAFNQFLNRTAATEMVSCGINASEYYFGEKAIQEKKIMHIPNSINVSKYIKRYDSKISDNLKMELGIPKNRIVIGHVGRFDANKNHRFLLTLAEKMKELGQSFVFVFIGTGKDYEDIAQEVEKRNLSDVVQLLGRREDVHDLYPLFDIFVLPSYSEGLPTVCVEAQAAGVPCIVSDTITKEIDMELNMVRFLSVKEKSEAWVAAIDELLQVELPTPEIIGQRIVANKFSNESAAQLYENFVFQRISHYEI